MYEKGGLHFKKNPITDSSDEKEWLITKTLTESEALEAYLIRTEQQESLRKAILGLDKKYGDAMIYRISYELSFQKVAQLMKISENSAKVLFLGQNL